MALLTSKIASDLVPESDLPSAAPDIVPESDLPKAEPRVGATRAPGWWGAPDVPRAAEQERKREAIEGPAPELEDAPIANAVLAGGVTGAVGGASAGALQATKSAVASGVDWGVNTALTDWADRLMGGPLKNHPWLRQMLSQAASIGFAKAVPSTIRLPGLRPPIEPQAAQQGADVLHKVAEARAIGEGGEREAGTATGVMEEGAGSAAGTTKEGVQGAAHPPVAPAEAPAAPATEPAPDVVPESDLPKAETGPVLLRPTVQPATEAQTAARNGDLAKTKESLIAELQRHPAATVYEMRVGDTIPDPERFQYKAGGDKSGAGLALRDIKTYDRGLAGDLTLYHDSDGRFYRVNGHQRAAALERLEGPDATHRAQIIESRAADDPQAVKGAVSYSKSPEQARTYGAIINIAEGRGTAMDAARFFRSEGMDTSAMESRGISLDPVEEKTQRAVALSRLSDTVFRGVEHGVVPEKLGVVIGRELGDSPVLQDGLYRMLKKQKGGMSEMPAAKLAEMIRLAKGSGERTETAMTLFGPQEMKKSLIAEQATVITGIKQRLRQERRLFGTAAAGAERLEEAGVGKVDVDTGERLSETAARNLDLLNRTAYVSGPVNQIIRDAAKQIAENPGKKASILRDAYPKIVDELGKSIPRPAPEAPTLFTPRAPEPAYAGARIPEDQFARLQRHDPLGVTPDANKPAGLYLSPGSIESPHAEPGDVRHDFVSVAQRPLDVDDVGKLPIRRGAEDSGAGVKALKKLDPALFNRAVAMSPRELRTFAAEQLTGVDVGRFTDKQEILEAMGAKVARDKGYDAIRHPDPEAPEFSEFVALKPSAIRPITSENQMTLGVGIPGVQAVEKVIGLLPEEARQSPARISAGDALARIFAPETRGALAERAAEVQEAKSAELRARLGSAANAIRPLRDYFQSLKRTERMDLASQMERGQFDALPKELQPFGPAMKKMTDAAHARLSALKPEQEIGYIENYWRHLWANRPEEVRDAFNRIRAGTGKPLTAGRGFLKQRKFPTISEGMAAGLTPRFNNPVDMWLAGVQQEWRHITGHEIWNAIRDIPDVAKYVRVTQRPPKGYGKINDSITNVLAPTEKGVAKLGEYYVPEEVARLYNNYLDPGLGMNPFASLSALGNRIRVGLSGFHFALTSLLRISREVGDKFIGGLGDIASGDILRGTAKVASAPLEIAKGPVTLARDWRLGKRTIAKVLAGNFEDPDVQNALLGGHEFGTAFNNPARLVADTWKTMWGIPQRAADHVDLAMRHWVAPLKVGAGLRLYNRRLAEAYEKNGNLELSLPERRTIATQVRKSLDNALGQIHRDNLHFSNRLKDSLHMLISYPGWQIGTLRLVGGTARGITKGVMGKPLDIQAQEALRYVSGLVITGGTVGTIMNYLMTGEFPKSAHEAFLWPTGDKDSNGNDLRALPPLYVVRDYLSLLGRYRQQDPNSVLAGPKAAAGLAAAKMNWPLAAAYYIYNQADYFGNPITFPDLESQPAQIRDIVKQFLEEGGVPFSARNIVELSGQGATLPRAAAAGLLGLTPEQRAVRQTPAQNLVARFEASQPRAQMLSPDQVQRHKVLSSLESGLRREKVGGAPADLTAVRDALAKGLVTEEQVGQRIKDAAKRPFAAAVNRAPALVTMQAWKAARDNGDTQDERDAAVAIRNKIASGAFLKLPPDQFAALKGLLTEFLQQEIPLESRAEEARAR